MGVLSVENVEVDYGGLKALQGVSFTLLEAGIFGLIGPNGAGKTTCINVLTGFATPTAGRTLLDGAALSGMSSDALRRMGISRTFQAGRLFSGLTVSENIAAAAIGLGQSRRQADATAAEILAWMGLSQLAKRRSGTLAYSDQRRVAIARALVGRPTHLLLDEPAAGMSEGESIELGRLIRLIRDTYGTSVLLVEHNIAMVLSVCEDILVLDGGMPIEAGPPSVIRKSVVVREAYLGSALDRREAIQVDILEADA
jgi:branched-chain amino acid transport system ATP-binding protein